MTPLDIFFGKKLHLYHWVAHIFSAEANYSPYSPRRNWCCTSVNLKEHYLLRCPPESSSTWKNDLNSQDFTCNRTDQKWLQRHYKRHELCNRPSEHEFSLSAWPAEDSAATTRGGITPVSSPCVSQASAGSCVATCLRSVREHTHLEMIGFFCRIGFCPDQFADSVGQTAWTIAVLSMAVRRGGTCVFNNGTISWLKVLVKPSRRILQAYMHLPESFSARCPSSTLHLNARISNLRVIPWAFNI